MNAAPTPRRDTIPGHGIKVLDWRWSWWWLYDDAPHLWSYTPLYLMPSWFIQKVRRIQ